MGDNGPVSAAATPVPSGPAFDLVLLAHVACAAVGLAAVVAAAVAAAALARVPPGTGPPPALHRYYRPGVNWPGRVLVGVPVFGVALLAMSHGAFGLGQGWVLAGLGLWLVATWVAEAVLWPAERRLQARVAAGGAGPSPDGRAVVRAGVAVAAVLVLAGVLMVVQP